MSMTGVLSQVVKALEDSGIAYVLVGSMASLLGDARLTSGWRSGWSSESTARSTLSAGQFRW